MEKHPEKPGSNTSSSLLTRRDAVSKLGLGVGALVTAWKAGSAQAIPFFDCEVPAGPAGWTGPYDSYSEAERAARSNDSMWTVDSFSIGSICCSYLEQTYVPGTIDMWSGSVSIGHYEWVTKTKCKWYYKDFQWP